MHANPILVEQSRGNWVENRHRGAFVVVDAGGKVILSAGNTARPIFPRSAIKAMQALAMATSGALDRFDLENSDLALACASHHGEEVHVAGVSRFLGRLGLSPEDLECGAHPPSNAAARDALRRGGGVPSSLHNNCSGKHAGMLAVALALGVPTRRYVERDHPVQLEVRRVIETVVGSALSIDRCGVDGCSIPTWAAPLEHWARGFARMATGDAMPGELAAASRRMLDAASAHPQLIAGSGHFDTVVMEAFGGRLVQKGGAEGVQCGVMRDRGWGYALKCDDGSMIASQVMAANLLLAAADPDTEQRAVLERFATQNIRNVRGLEVGRIGPAESFGASGTGG